jgi:hypothetical protein
MHYKVKVTQRSDDIELGNNHNASNQPPDDNPPDNLNQSNEQGLQQQQQQPQQQGAQRDQGLNNVGLQDVEQISMQMIHPNGQDDNTRQQPDEQQINTPQVTQSNIQIITPNSPRRPPPPPPPPARGNALGGRRTIVNPRAAAGIAALTRAIELGGNLSSSDDDVNQHLNSAECMEHVYQALALALRGRVCNLGVDTDQTDVSGCENSQRQTIGSKNTSRRPTPYVTNTHLPTVVTDYATPTVDNKRQHIPDHVTTPLGIRNKRSPRHYGAYDNKKLPTAPLVTPRKPQRNNDLQHYSQDNGLSQFVGTTNHAVRPTPPLPPYPPPKQNGNNNDLLQRDVTHNKDDTTTSNQALPDMGQYNITNSMAGAVGSTHVLPGTYKVCDNVSCNSSNFTDKLSHHGSSSTWSGNNTSTSDGD